MSMQQQQLLNV